MARSAIAEVMIPKTLDPLAGSLPGLVPAVAGSDVCHVPVGAGFLSDTLLENNHIKSSSRMMDLMVALAFHIVLIGTPILAGLYFTDTLNLKQFAATFLVAPPPPPPAPPPAAAAMKTMPPKRVFMQSGKLIAPTFIPKEVALIKEAPLESDAFEGVAGGVPGGVAGGSMGGVLGGIIGGTNTTVKPPAPVYDRKTPMRVGGRVREPRVISRVAPEYPALAKQSHLTGEVVIDTILDEEGNVTDMKVMSGPPLLYNAALTALAKWKYEPTYLNEQPIAVRMIVTVRFQMSGFQ
jgi:periplasmic protein TonB